MRAQDSFELEENLVKPEDEGQLAVDVYQMAEGITLIAPIAGVDPDDLEIAITDEVVSIRGRRHQAEEVGVGDYLLQECYWGSFSRSYVVPCPIELEKVTATVQNGLLKLFMPRLERATTRVIKIGRDGVNQEVANDNAEATTQE